MEAVDLIESARRVPAGARRWEAIARQPAESRMRRVEMEIDPWWVSKSENVRYRVFANGRETYLHVQGISVNALGRRKHFSQWYRLLP